MSASPPSDDIEDTTRAVDELAERGDGKHPAVGGLNSMSTSGKRPRGRPKGSKNKKTLEKEAAAGATGSGPSASGVIPALPSAVDPTGAPETQKKKRGRPPKQKADDGEPPVKKKRGRPPKNPKPPGGEDGEMQTSGVTSPEKKKRGRPPKSASATK